MAGKLVRKVCFLHEERDARLLAWLTAQTNESATIRHVLSAYLEGQPTCGLPVGVAPVTLNPQVIHEAVTEALAETLDLAAFRRIVEAAVQSVLANQPGWRAGSAMTPTEPGEADELDAALDDLDRNLVIG